MKKILFFILSFANAFPCVVFHPDEQIAFNKYYSFDADITDNDNANDKVQEVCPFFAKHHMQIAPDFVSKNRENQCFVIPQILSDLFIILKWDEFQKKITNMTEASSVATYYLKADAIKSLNDEIYYFYEENNKNLSKIFENLINELKNNLIKNPDDKKYQGLLSCEKLLGDAFQLEETTLKNDEIVLWRFSELDTLDNNLLKNKVLSFGYSLLAGYILDGYQYNNIPFLSNASACVYTYFISSLKLKKNYPSNVSTHTLFALRISQEYLQNNLTFDSKIDGEEHKGLPTLGLCPPIAQVASGQGEYFHPRIKQQSIDNQKLTSFSVQDY